MFGARHDVYAAGVGQTWASSSCSGNCGSGGNRKPGSGNALTAADLDGDGDIDVVAFPGATYRTQHGHISPNSAQDHGQPLPAVFINVNGDGISFVCGDIYCSSCWNFFQEFLRRLGMQPHISIEISRVRYQERLQH